MSTTDYERIVLILRPILCAANLGTAVSDGDFRFPCSLFTALFTRATNRALKLTYALLKVSFA